MRGVRIFPAFGPYCQWQYCVIDFVRCPLARAIIHVQCYKCCNSYQFVPTLQRGSVYYTRFLISIYICYCSRHGFLYIRGWMQMVMAPNDLFSWNNKYKKYMSLRIFTLSSWSYARELTLCMLAFWSHEGVVFLDFLPSPHLVTSFRLPCLGSTDAHCPRWGDPVPLPPKWHPFSQGPRTLPYRDPEQLFN